MQYEGTPPGGVATPGRWRIEVPANAPKTAYVVSVSVGDCTRTDSIDELTVNGTEVIHQFQPTSTNKFKQGTAQLTVRDTTGDGHGYLIFNAAGGTNTKIDYITIQLVSLP
jgi:hypothetical protein